MDTVPSLANTLGALFIGFGVSTMLYGMFLVQSLNYFRRYPSDKVGYKIIITLLLVLETVHQAFIGHSVYYYTITNFMDIFALVGKPIWSLAFQLLLGSLVGSIVKFLFTLRVWRFSYGNIWVVGVLLLLNFGQLVLAVIFTVKSYELPTLIDLVNLRVLGVTALVIGVVNDIGIAMSLCYYLQTIRACYTQSNSLIRILTLYAVSTGVLTSAMSFTTLIIYNFMPENLIFVSCYFVLSKLYAVSFVAALNTRQLHRELTNDEPKKISSLQRVADQLTNSISIQLQTSAIVRHDSDIECAMGGENGVPIPTSTTEETECTEETRRPPYTAGW